MKQIIFLFFATFLSLSAGAQSKRAIVIAIGEYAPLDGKGWRKLSSVNDTALVLPSLRKQGFLSTNTTLLLNEKATIENIRSAFKEVTSNTKENDLVVVHISAHGCQIEDDNNDEIDKLDESIVTYNAISPKYSKDFKNDVKNYLRDDELGKMIDALREASGKKGEVLVIMDNCHSGSGTRAVDVVFRGGEPALRSGKPSSTVVGEKSVSGDNYSLSEKLAPIVVLSASRADELNQEIRIDGKGYGSLSYAVSKAMDELNPNSTYQGFYSSVQSTMNQLVPRQHPVIEGNGINKEFWGGDFKIKPVFFTITGVKDEQMVVIDGGIVSGISKGSVVHLYSPDTYDTTKAKVIAIGTVTSSENFKSTVDLSTPLPNVETPYWAFLKKVYFPLPAIGVSFEAVESMNEKALTVERKNKYTEALKSCDHVSIDASPALRISQRNGKDVLVEHRTDCVFDTLGNTEISVQKLNASIFRYVQYQFLKNYVLNDTNYRVSVRFIPMQNDRADTSLLRKKQVNGVLTLNDGDKVCIEVTNHSKTAIFFNLIDLEPTGKINAVMPKTSRDPRKNIPANELTVPPGTIVIFEKFPINIYKPYGEEVFKIFVSNKMLDLEYITGNTRDVKKDSDITSDLERVFKNSYKSGSRGDLGTKDGSVINFPFIIEPRK
jgi:hypothetical protein